MTTDENHLTVLQTAAVLEVHPRTVWRYLQNGRLTAVRHPLSRRVYVRESQVREARERGRQAAYGERPESPAG